MRKGDGDGTVPLVSLGLMCRKGWKSKALNPGGIKVTTHELKHEAVPISQGPRYVLLTQYTLNRRSTRRLHAVAHVPCECPDANTVLEWLIAQLAGCCVSRPARVRPSVAPTATTHVCNCSVSTL